MKTLKVYGASDDLVEADGIPGADEFSKHTCDACQAYIGRMLVSAGNEAICIHAVYAGSWSFAITSENADDDFETLPDWPVRRTFGIDVPYSETLEIDVPNDAHLKWLEF